MSTGLNNNIMPQCREKKRQWWRVLSALFQNHLQSILIGWGKMHNIYIVTHMQLFNPRGMLKLLNYLFLLLAFLVTRGEEFTLWTDIWELGILYVPWGKDLEIGWEHVVCAIFPFVDSRKPAASSTSILTLLGSTSSFVVVDEDVGLGVPWVATSVDAGVRWLFGASKKAKLILPSPDIEDELRNSSMEPVSVISRMLFWLLCIV